MDASIPSQSQTPSRSFVDEMRQLLRLGLPIAAVQLGLTGLNFVDVAMLGHHDPASLPAMALGNTVAWIASMFCMGALTAVDPLLAQAIGAKDHAAVPRVFGRALFLALLLVVPAGLLLWPAPTWLRLCGQPDALLADAAAYARWQILALLPFLWFTTCRSLLSARARVLPQVLTIVGGNLANALLDWILIYGHWGAPALGVHGAALATVLCRWLMLGMLLWSGWRELGPCFVALGDEALRRSALAFAPAWRLLRLGAPIGAQFLLEIGVFAATALLIGHLDATAGDGGDAGGPRLAGHQIALQLASFSFMVPLGIGMAASVRVGWAVGRGDPASARRAAGAALAAGAAVMSGFMLLFLLAPGPLAGLLSAQPAHLAVAVALIPIAGVFQIGDGLQVVAIGCLRGLGDVRSPMYTNLVGFWLIGLPLGCWFGFARGGGPAGLWWGLVIGLFAVAAVLLVVLRLRLAERRSRLAVD
jgi:MATE family multidrug resistance protein